LQVPLGNFEFDWLMFTVDTFFSRALRDNQQVSCFIWFCDLESEYYKQLKLTALSLFVMFYTFIKTIQFVFHNGSMGVSFYYRVALPKKIKIHYNPISICILICSSSRCFGYLMMVFQIWVATMVKKTVF
jgi:hypothetical protein